MIGMLERFREYLEEQSLCAAGDKILVTVSGGIDSVVLLDLLISAGYMTGVAHCNFRLRGEESEADEAFVKSIAAREGLEFYRQDFKTEEYAREQGVSVQMAARDLRYTWFEEIRARHDYDLIATAHNQDDVLETFFVNLSRGTGIRGLTGIAPVSGKVIRPLLFASRESISAYATDRGITYREDSSNASEKYLRNRIRHSLLPLLEEENPSFRKSLMETIARLSETEILFRDEIQKLKEKLLRQQDDRILIPIPELQKLESRKTILHEMLSEFGFGGSQLDDILLSIDAAPGKQFFSPTHRLVKDREELILSPLGNDEKRRYYLELESGQIFDPVDLEWIIVEHTEKFSIPKDPNIACLDLDMLDFPLILRRWEKGDSFKPFGMKGMKKISDFLIDEKVSLPDKERTWLLASGQKIVWVVGYRIDDGFRISPSTRQVLMIRYLPAGDN
jgi:tRNA(Ile)-lysidine synthase